MTDRVDIPRLDAIDSIRRRPAMYIGGTDFFGFIHYVVSAFDTMLEHGATWIEIEVGEHLSIASDARLPIRLNDEGKLEPFESFGPVNDRHIPDATIIAALSEDFRAVVSDGTTETELVCEHGIRIRMEQRPANVAEHRVQLTFTPDIGIFAVTDVSSEILRSYCRRTSCLWPRVWFRIRQGGQAVEYRSQNGIPDFFDSIALPYQILHKPIRLRELSDSLTVEAVFAFHSWSENRIWSFANRGRVPDGGTHEAGMMSAIARLQNNLRGHNPVGVLAVLAIEYPQVTYEGCIKSRIGNPELIGRVEALVRTGIEKWATQNVEEIEYLKTIERFTFGEAW
ncbi:MAG: hypothetical protein KDA87_24890 [Planctomycetales bacterium]|nr:hypothetical protein [Planctomycetales bacterium]